GFALQSAEEAEARQQAEEALRESEERFRRTFEDAPIGMTLVALDGCFLRVNPALCRMWGYTEDALLTTNYQSLTHPDNLAQGNEQVARLLRGEISTYQIEKRYIHKDGHEVWAHLNVSLVHDASGQPLHFVSQVEDITERRRVEAEVRHSEERYRNLLERAPVAIIVRDADRVLYANAAAASLLAVDESAALVGLPVLAIAHPDCHGVVAERTRLLKAGQAVPPKEQKYRRFDGTVAHVETVAIPCTYEGRRAFQTVAVDITARKRAEEALREHARKTEALAAISHAAAETGKDYEALLDTASAQAALVVGDGCVVRLLEDEGQILKTVAVRHDDPAVAEDMRAALQAALASGQEGPDTGVLQTGQALFVPNVGAGGSRAELALAGCLPSGLRPHGLIAVPLHVQGRTIGTLTLVRGEPGRPYTYEDLGFVEAAADRAAVGIETARLLAANESELAERKRAEARLQQSLESLRRAMEGTIRAVASTVEMRDPYTAGHQQRVAQLATAIARQMGLDEEQVEAVRLAASVHDLGKIGVPAEILSKPGRLTPLEWQMIQGHSEVGYQILSKVDFPWPVAEIAYQHHERLDGSGYPRGLRGAEIAAEARILAVADVVEAMSSHRPYRPALGLEVALEEITGGRGTLYDSNVVDVCLALLTKDGAFF
ncbi:MAG: PAS domain S-box protein, partial [Chloroflexota bacterium]